MTEYYPLNLKFQLYGGKKGRESITYYPSLQEQTTKQTEERGSLSQGSYLDQALEVS